LVLLYEFDVYNINEEKWEKKMTRGERKNSTNKRSFTGGEYLETE